MPINVMQVALQHSVQQPYALKR